MAAPGNAVRMVLEEAAGTEALRVGEDTGSIEVEEAAGDAAAAGELCSKGEAVVGGAAEEPVVRGGDDAARERVVSQNSRCSMIKATAKYNNH